VNVFTGTVVSASSVSSGCRGVEDDAVSDFFFDCDGLEVDCFVLFDEAADVSVAAYGNFNFLLNGKQKIGINQFFSLHIP